MTFRAVPAVGYAFDHWTGFSGRPTLNATVPWTLTQPLAVTAHVVKAPGFYAHEGTAPRAVAFSNGFWLGRTEVTRGQWQQFVEATGYRTDAERAGAAWCRRADGTWGMVEGKSWHDPNWIDVDLRPDHPVACVSWNDAQAFCAWLNTHHAAGVPAGYAFRLPAESEWEYACRRGAPHSANPAGPCAAVPTSAPQAPGDPPAAPPPNPTAPAPTSASASAWGP